MKCTRGKLRVYATQVLFINDDETGSIELKDGENVLNLTIIFEPGINQSVQHPGVNVSKEKSRSTLTFVDWNQSLVYLALEPIEIGHLGPLPLYMAVTNSYIGKTNRLEMQFYV